MLLRVVLYQYEVPAELLVGRVEGAGEAVLAKASLSVFLRPRWTIIW
ncbi:hypothetical protein [Streptomyces olivoreticuli]|nr:hypothetical protein [Streptomyces olivoreticuli]